MQSAALEMIGEMYVVGEMDEGMEHGDEDVVAIAHWIPDILD